MAVKYDYAYLRGYIKEHFGSNRDFADFIGVGESALYDRLASKVPFKQTEIDKVASERNLDADDVMRLFFTRKVRKSV